MIYELRIHKKCNNSLLKGAYHTHIIMTAEWVLTFALIPGAEEWFNIEALLTSSLHVLYQFENAIYVNLIHASAIVRFMNDNEIAFMITWSHDYGCVIFGTWKNLCAASVIYSVVDLVHAFLVSGWGGIEILSFLTEKHSCCKWVYSRLLEMSY